jgi:erythromycin esterase-like protein
MTTNQPEGTTHMERLRAALDSYDHYVAADQDDYEWNENVLDAADELAERVRELLAEIEHIKGGGEPTDRM